MMPAMLTRLTLIMLALTLCMPVAAKDNGKSKKTPAKTPFEELMLESGLEEELSQLPVTLYHSMDYSQTQLGDKGMRQEQREALSREITRAYGMDLAREEAMRHLKQNLRARDVSQVLAWLRSPSGQVISKAERASASDSMDVFAKMQAYYQALALTPAPKSYVDAINTIMKLQESHNVVSRLTMEGNLLGEAAGASASGQFDPDKFNHRVMELIIKSSVPQPEMVQETRRHLMFTYRDVPETDLHRYINFLQSDAGKRFSYSVVSTYLSLLDKGRDILTGRLAGMTPVAGNAEQDPVNTGLPADGDNRVTSAPRP